MNITDFVPDRGLDAANNLFRVVERRLWSKPGKLHVELPHLDEEEYDDYTWTLRSELEAVDGVIWARANGATGRMIVAWDEARGDKQAILDVVEDIEDRYSFDDGEYHQERPDHPGDDEPIVRGIASVASAFVGAGAGVLMKILRRKPGRHPFDFAAMMSVVDNVPHIRQMVVDKFGKSKAETWIGLTNPLIQGLGSGPIGPALDCVYQVSQFLEVVERRRGWRSREADLCTHPESAKAARRQQRERPIPIPDGPIEEYADDAWNMSLGGFIVGLADTQELESAVTPLLDALPKPGRYGRDAYCAQLTSVFADRHMIVMDPEALRRMDRIDCVVVDADLLVTDRYRLDRIACGADTDAVAAFKRAEDLLDPLHPELEQSGDGWTLKPADDSQIPEKWTAQLRSKGARGDLLALWNDGEPRALFSLRVLTDRASRMFIDAIHEHGLELIIVSDDKETVREFGPHRVKQREGIHRFIRHIQRDHQVVAYLGVGPSKAMDVADISLGFTIRGASVPWGADVIAGDELEDATFFVEAIAEARNVSERCALFAGSGAGIGALSAIQGLDKARPGRVMLAVNSASLIALVYGSFRARRLERRVDTPDQQPVPWHRLRVDDVFQRLGSGVDGLHSIDIDERGDDVEELARHWRALRSVGRELANPLTPVLAGGAAVSAIVGSITDAGIVGAVIAFNGLVGGLERFKAEESIEKMANREVIEVDVRRDGQWQSVATDNIVVGDVIRLEHGDVVPADCRIVDAEQLEVDESSLTGESLPVTKSADPSFSTLPSDRTSMLYDGTAIVAGFVEAVVVATGTATEIQRSRWIGRQSDVAEGVEARLKGFSDMTLPFVSAVGGLLMSLGVFRRRELEELVGPAVNLAVGAVPEGLPLLATTAQLAAARRLSDRNVIVQNPRAMEAIGRADVLCIDKTGTLTEGTLQLDGIFDGHSMARPSDWDDSHRAVFETALRATPYTSNGGVLPHATDQAIVDGARNADVDVGDWSIDDEIPFRTELAFHAVLGRDGGRKRLAVKGSPEEVLKRCSGWRRDGAWANLSKTRRREFLERAQALAGDGLRLLAVAGRRFRGDADDGIEPDDIQGLTFYGFVTLSDPIRPRAKEAVKSLHSAGVSLMMLTGDHPETARRIARDVGLDIGSVLTGDQIAVMDDAQLADALADATVIARMTPAHKVRIVEALQEAGRAVAMTGDGGNDAAAIRLADAGIALGADASTAARDAADLVVSDARVETIVDAVVEGRAMWRSVRDAVSILIGGNLGEILFMLGSGVVKTIPALNARQLLLVNLFTDVAPALAIALRPPPDVSPEDLLHEGPEESLGESLERDIAWRAGITGGSAFLAWLFARHSFQKKRASTIGLLTVVTSQLGQTLTSAKPSAPVWAASLGSTAGLLVLIETPGVSQLLGCRPLGPVGLTTAFGAAGLATATSIVIPRIPAWRREIARRLPTEPEPTQRDFFDDFYEHFPDGDGRQRL